MEGTGTLLKYLVGLIIHEFSENRSRLLVVFGSFRECGSDLSGTDSFRYPATQTLNCLPFHLSSHEVERNRVTRSNSPNILLRYS